MTIETGGLPTAESVDEPLDVLETSGLIRLATKDPELEYLFRHVLVQDAAYESLLKQERRRLHSAVAAAIEKVAPERRADLAGMLAWHYEAAGDSERALPALIEAGWQAIRRYANVQAWDFFERAQALLGNAQTEAQTRQRIDIALGMVRAGFVTRPSGALLEIIDGVRPLAERLGDRRLLGRVLVWIAVVRWQMGEQYEPGTPFGDAIDGALQIADEVGDRGLRGLALTILGRSSLLSSDPRRAAEVLREAITLTSEADFIGASMAANTLASALGMIGDFDAADEAIVRAKELADRSGDPTAILDAGIASIMLETERGNYGLSATNAAQSAARAKELGAGACAVVANYLAGNAEVMLGNPGLAVAPLQLSIDLAEENQFRWWGNFSVAALSSARCGLGDVDEAKAGWQTALDRAQTMRDESMEAAILQQRARLLVELPGVDLKALAEDLDRAADVDARIGARPRLANVLHLRAEVRDRLGRPAEAAADRKRADALSAEMGMTPLSEPVGGPVR